MIHINTVSRVALTSRFQQELLYGPIMLEFASDNLLHSSPHGHFACWAQVHATANCLRGSSQRLNIILVPHSDLNRKPFR